MNEKRTVRITMAADVFYSFDTTDDRIAELLERIDKAYHSNPFIEIRDGLRTYYLNVHKILSIKVLSI